MAELSILQLIAYGIMGAFLALAVWRTASALDLAYELAGERDLARQVLRDVESGDPRRRSKAWQRMNTRLSRAPDSALVRLFERLAARRERGLEPALARFADGVLRRIEPVRHGLSQLMRVAAPLGLAFTTLVLAVSLTTLDPAADEGPNGLLKALPLSLVTTVMAMIAVIPMRLAEGRLRHVAEDLVGIAETLVEEVFADATTAAPPPAELQREAAA